MFAENFVFHISETLVENIKAYSDFQNRSNVLHFLLVSLINQGPVTLKS
jgi:hypothetical protein